MSSGKAHDLVLLMTVPVVATTLWVALDRPDIGLAVGVGVLSGMLLTPDLDTHSRSLAHARRLRVGALWFWYWWLYRVMFSHRGMSHWFLVGTLTRVAYFVPAWPIWWPWQAWAYWLAGLVLADTVHLAMDGMLFNRRQK